MPRRVSPKDKAMQSWRKKDFEPAVPLMKKFINSYIGAGVFAACDIQPREFICLYPGEICSGAEGMKRMKKYKEKGCYMYFFSHKNKNLCIDGTHAVGIGKYINDSPKPNCKIELLEDSNNEPFLAVVALGDNIKANAELVYDYKDLPENMYWRKGNRNPRPFKNRTNDDFDQTDLPFISGLSKVKVNSLLEERQPDTSVCDVKACRMPTKTKKSDQPEGIDDRFDQPVESQKSARSNNDSRRLISRRLKPSDRAISAWKENNYGAAVPVRKQFINTYVGSGVFAANDIQPGEFICLYPGELCTAASGMKKINIYKQMGSYIYFFRHKNRDLCIDGTHALGIGKYINDSPKPNCKVELLEGQGEEPFLAVFALGDVIKAHEQLLYDYKDIGENMYWRRNEPNPQPYKSEEDCCVVELTCGAGIQKLDVDALSGEIEERPAQCVDQDCAAHEKAEKTVMGDGKQSTAAEKETDNFFESDKLIREIEQSASSTSCCNTAETVPTENYSIPHRNEEQGQEINSVPIIEQIGPSNGEKQTKTVTDYANQVDNDLDMLDSPHLELLFPEKHLHSNAQHDKKEDDILLLDSVLNELNEYEEITGYTFTGSDEFLENNSASNNSDQTQISTQDALSAEQEAADAGVIYMTGEEFDVDEWEPFKAGVILKSSIEEKKVTFDYSNSHQELTILPTPSTSAAYPGTHKPEQSVIVFKQQTQCVQTTNTKQNKQTHDISGSDSFEVDARNPDNKTHDKHVVLSESRIQRCRTHPGIFVRNSYRWEENGDGGESSKRTFQSHCCCFCGKLFSNILAHIRTHKDEEEVMQMLELEKNPEKNKSQITLIHKVLRNRGDYLHNKHVWDTKKGELLLARRSKHFVSTDYSPCPECLEWFKLSTLAKHRVCPGSHAKLSTGEILAKSAVLVGKIGHKASATLQSEVFTIMRRDEAGYIARTDELIVALGDFWLRMNIGNSLKRKYYTSSRMRRAARLLACIREKLNNPDLTMREALHPNNFDTICEATLDCAGKVIDDEEQLATPSEAIKMGYDLSKMLSIMEGNILKDERCGYDSQKRRDCKSFRRLLKLEWAVKVSKIARNVLRERRENQSHHLPVPEDLSKLAAHLKQEIASLKLDATVPISEESAAEYRKAVMLVQARLLLFNKRRSGELEATKLVNYESMQEGLSDDELKNMPDLSELEKKMLASLSMFMIRGKVDARVPVIVPPDCEQALRFIANKHVRKAAGVKNCNDRLFANSGDGVHRAYESLKAVCGACSLKSPERITSVNLRKYIATMSQVIGMSDDEVDQLCRHLGHSVEVHKMHYKHTSGYIQRINIGKLMLMQELNVLKHFAGTKLVDLSLSDIINASPVAEVTDERIDINVTEPENAQDLEAEEDAFYLESVGIEDDRSSPAAGDQSIPVIPSGSRKKSASQRTCVQTRVCWNEKEEKEIRELLNSFLSLRKVPNRQVCEQAIAKSKLNNGLIQHRGYLVLQKKVRRMIENQVKGKK